MLQDIINFPAIVGFEIEMIRRDTKAIVIPFVPGSSHPAIDRLSQWVLQEESSPVGKVEQPHRQPELPQLAYRRFFEEVHHPVIGRSRYSTLPMRFSGRPERFHGRHAPLLGEHNAELLGELGLTRSEIGALEADGIIGDSLR